MNLLYKDKRVQNIPVKVIENIERNTIKIIDENNEQKEINGQFLSISSTNHNETITISDYHGKDIKKIDSSIDIASNIIKPDNLTLYFKSIDITGNELIIELKSGNQISLTNATVKSAQQLSMVEKPINIK